MSKNDSWAFVWRRYDDKSVRTAVHETKKAAQKDRAKLLAACYELSVWVGPVTRIPLVVSKGEHQ